ncbi:Golgi reassembly stacking protein, partial [Trypanosoma grayi]|uniref:Golgi reassembly stacking protein n=1 Tax=Trypanosoma grayi TaxID=71804 RepID=UPI0004F439D0
MGQKESKGENPLKGIVGLQVARVLPHSPAHAAGLLPFFDIITEVNQTVLMDAENATEQFKSYVMERESQQLCFKVYNLRIRAYRDVFCVPSRSWGGGGMLGCSIEWCRADQCVERSWHIVDIVPGGPVGRCPEIQAERDYIIGMQRAEEPVVTLIRDEDDFYARVDMWRSLQRVALQRLQRRSRVVPASANAGTTGLEMIGKLIFLIYDAVANEIKEVAVDLGPDVDAPLGMNLATGLLHSLLVSPPSAEGGADDDGGGRSEGGNSGLPVLTAFVAASGTIEKAEQGMPMP